MQYFVLLLKFDVVQSKIPEKEMTYGVFKSVMYASLHIFPWRQNDEKSLSQISKIEYTEIKNAWKEAKWAIAQNCTFLGNGIIEA